MNLPTILNVALGLVVLYFLLSTIASLLLELLTNAAQYREEILFVTINRLLAGQPDRPWNLLHLVWDRIGQRAKQNPLLSSVGAKMVTNYQITAPGKSADDRKEDIVQKFWQHPKIKSLTTLGADAPPAMEPDTFARVLVEIAVPRDTQGALPDNPLALKRALAVPGSNCPPGLQHTLLNFCTSGEIPASASGEALWTPYRASIAAWFGESAKRSTETYRISMKYLLLGAGLVLAALLNADTVRTVQILSHDRSLQETTAAFAATLTQENRENASAAQGGTAAPSTSTKELREKLSKDIDYLRQLDSIGFPLGWRGPDHGFYNLELYDKAQAALPKSWLKAGGYFFAFGLLKFVGLAATALAVTMGAPFWYDLMNRLVGFRRGSADSTKPAGAAAPAGVPAGAALTGGGASTAANPLEIGHDLAAPAIGFDPRKAYWLARAAKAAYAGEAEIRQLVIGQWKFHEFRFFDSGIDPKAPDQGSTQGFCAYDDQLVLLAFRGTELKRIEDIEVDADVKQTSFGPIAPGRQATVHTGFYRGFSAVQNQLQDSFEKWCTPGRRIIITGHSLGGAIATLWFAQIATTKAASRPLLYTFGCPKVGNKPFAQDLDAKYPGQIFRLVNEIDVVPTLPPLPDYFHAGQGIHFEPNGVVRMEISGLGRFLEFAASAAKNFKQAGEEAINDHDMSHYLERTERLVKPA